MDFKDKVIQKIIDLFNVFDVDQIFYYLSILPIVFLIELAVVGWEKSSLLKLIKSDKSVRTDFVYFLIEFFNLYNLITVLISFGVFLCWFLLYWRFLAIGVGFEFL